MSKALNQSSQGRIRAAEWRESHMVRMINRRLTCFIVILIAASSLVPTVLAQHPSQPIWQEPTANLVSSWAVTAPTLDGRISSELEWADAYAQKIVLYHNDGSTGNYFLDQKLQATYFAKNDADWLYLLVHVNSTTEVPQYTDIAYFWPVSHGTWPNSTVAGIDTGNDTREGYGWNEKDWQYSGSNNVKGAASCHKQEASGMDCWFEYAKRLRSDNVHDWRLNLGDILGQRPPDLVVNLGTDKNYYSRYVMLYLSSESEGTPTRINSTFAWRAEGNFSYAKFLLSPNFTINADPGVYQVDKIALDAKVTRPFEAGGKRDFYAFDIGVAIGNQPESFGLVCPKYCSSLSSNRYYGLALTLAPYAIGNQQLKLEIDFSQMHFTVSTSNSSTPPPTLIGASDPLRYDSTFATSGKIFVNLIFWSGHFERRDEVLTVQNVTASIALVREPRLLENLPKPIFEKSWTFNASGEGLSAPVVGVAVSSDGHVLAAVDRFNARTETAEVYLLDSEGRLVWSRYYHGGSFFWFLMNVALTPDSKLAAYAIYSSNNASSVGIWYVDENGHVIWVQNEPWYHSVAMSSDGKLIAAVGATKGSGESLQPDGKLLVLDDRGQVLWQRKFLGELPMRASVSPEGGFIAVTTGIDASLPGATNSSVYLFDRTGNILWRHVGPAIVRSVDLSSSAESVVISYSDGTVEILDKSGVLVERYLHSYRLPNLSLGGDTWSATTTPDGNLIVTSQGYGLFIFTGNLSQLIAVPSIDESVISVAASSGGKLIVAGTYEGVLYLYTLSSERSVEYARFVIEAARDAGLSTGSTIDVLDRMESEGGIGAYLQSRQLINQTIVALRAEYSKAYAQAQAGILEASNLLNATTNRLQDTKSQLNSTQQSKALALLSEASGSLKLAQQYVAEAPNMFRSGDLPIAVKFVHRAIDAVQQTRARIADSESSLTPLVTPTQNVQLQENIVVFLVLALVPLGILVVLMVRRKKSLRTLHS